MLSKRELHRQIKLFLQDKERGISAALFAELCGIDKRLLQRVFLTDEMPMSEATQRRVDRAYEHWKAGSVRVMQRRDQTRFVDYRKQPISPVRASASLRVQAGKLTLRIGPSNHHDYSEPTIFEALGAKR